MRERARRPTASARRRRDAGTESRDLSIELSEGRFLVLVRDPDLGGTGQTRHALIRAQLGHQVPPLALELDEAELVHAVIPAQGYGLEEFVDEGVVRGDRRGGKGHDEDEGEKLAHSRIVAQRGSGRPVPNRARSPGRRRMSGLWPGLRGRPDFAKSWQDRIAA